LPNKRYSSVFDFEADWIGGVHDALHRDGDVCEIFNWLAAAFEVAAEDRRLE
jgi:hypothetical protein